VLRLEAKEWDCNVTPYSVLEGKEWGLQCGAIFCVLCCKAKDGDCNVALYSVLEGKGWGL